MLSVLKILLLLQWWRIVLIVLSHFDLTLTATEHPLLSLLFQPEKVNEQ